MPAFPPVLAVQPITDATIVWRGVIDGLLGRLAPNGYHLLLYDVNHLKAFAFVTDDARVPGVDATADSRVHRDPAQKWQVIRPAQWSRTCWRVLAETSQVTI